MRFEEDRAVIYALFNIAESLKYVGKYGILQIRTHGSMTRRKKNLLIINSHFIYIKLF